MYQCRTNGTWTNTGIKVRNYISVVVSGNITIGDNGNWFSDGEDTGIPATPSVDEQLDNIITKHESLSRTIQGIAVTGGFSDVGYALRDQTCNLDKSIGVVGDRIIAKLDASEKAAMQDKINALQTQLTTEHQSGVIAQQIAAAVNPIAQAVNEIKCAQPQTVTVPYQPFQAVPNCVAYQYGMYNGCNNINGFWL